MQTQSPVSRDTAAPTRSPWLVLLISVLIVAVIGLAAWAIIDLMASDDLDTATERVDEWLIGWNASDPEAIAAVFTEDAVYTDPTQTLTGEEEIYQHAVSYANAVSKAERLAPGSEPATERYGFVICFDSYGGTFDGEIEVELEGELINRFEWLYWKAAD